MRSIPLMTRYPESGAAKPFAHLSHVESPVSTSTLSRYVHLFMSPALNVNPPRGPLPAPPALSTSESPDIPRS